MERVFVELSPRRDEIAQLYALGFEKKEVACRLVRSVRTVENTLRVVFRSLNVSNGRELSISYAERKTGCDLRKAITTVVMLLFRISIF